MNTTALFYSFNTKHTAEAASRIARELGEARVDKINIETIDEQTFMAYENMILGVSTWFDGELPNYWDEFLPAMDAMDFKGKKIALFGPADQKGYPQNFADAIGILASFVRERGATLVGTWPAAGYTFLRSKALDGDHLMGLVLDYVNQPELTEKRIIEWVAQVKKSFK